MKTDEQLIWEAYSERKTFDDLVKENTYINDDFLYHATTIQGLYGILKNGFQFNPLGVMAEDYTLSTSLNPDMVDFFGSDEHSCRITIKGPPFNVFIVPRWFMEIHSDSGIEQTYSDEEVDSLLQKYSIKGGRFSKVQDNYIQNNLPDGYIASMMDYVADYMEKGGMPYNDEMEITFYPQGEDYLNNNIWDISVDDESGSKEEIINYLEENYEEEYLTKEIYG